MRSVWVFFFIILFTLGLAIESAEAKRFGGGRSFGMHRSATNHTQAPASSNFKQHNPSTASKWLGPLAGLAAGGLLASLFMGHGLGSGILSWLAVGGIALLLWNLIRNKMRPMTQPMQFSGLKENIIRNVTPPANVNYSQSSIIDFDTESFLRNAKVQFIRLQAAYDSQNLNDIREFTTPDVFAEIQLQFHERNQESNHTEVVKLEAKLVEMATELGAKIASVHFSGLIRETVNLDPAPFNETWHFSKPENQATWIVSGVQQH